MSGARRATPPIHVGRLTVGRKLQSIRAGELYLCLCNCGREQKATRADLVTGRVTECRRCRDKKRRKAA